MNRFFKPLVLIAILSTAFTATRVDAQEPNVETFYQHVDIQRNPRFVVQGLNVGQQVHYQIRSTFGLGALDDKGCRSASQTITDAILVKADPLSRAVFANSLENMIGDKYTYKLDENAQIVSMQGHENNTKPVDVQRPDAQGILVSNVIDEDGWKELAQLTLFQPPQPLLAGKPFSKKTTHDWGDLGSWYGNTNFTSLAGVRGMKRYRYRHQLDYVAPDEGAAGAAAGNLPFAIDKADFRIQEAWGEMNYDPRHKQVTAVKEIFHARGSIATSVLGVASAVEVEEKQIFTISVTRQRTFQPAPQN